MRKNKEKIGVALVFIVFLVIGLCIVCDFGVSFDEVIERTGSLVTYKYIMPISRYILTDTANFPALPDLLTFVNRYYGMAIQMVPVVVEHLFKFQLSEEYVYLIRHVYTFLIFYVSLVYFYYLLKECDIKKRYSLCGVVMMFLSPRIFADSFYNIKDLPFLSFTIINLYYALRFIKYNKMSDGILLCISSAVCANIRIVGAIFFVITLLLWIVSEKKKSIGKKLVQAFVMGFVCLGCFILIMPSLWKNPVIGIKELLQTFSSFSNWGGANYYLGTWWPEGTEPWHYMFVWIFITTPMMYSLLALLGIGKSVKEAGEVVLYKKGEVKKHTIILSLSVIIPFSYLLIGNPVVYNGWRHFFFVYPIIIFFAVDFLQSVFLNGLKLWKYIVGGFLLMSVIGTAMWMINNHPYEYVYFNPVVRSFAGKYFEKDYWSVSEHDQMEYILKNDRSEDILVYAVSGTGYYLLPKAERERMDLVDIRNISKADYVIKTYSETPETELFASQYLYEDVNDIVVDNMIISSLFERKYHVAYEVTIKFEGQKVLYTSDEIQWEKLCNEDTCQLQTKDFSQYSKENVQKIILNKQLYEQIQKVELMIDGAWESYEKLDFICCVEEYVLELGETMGAICDIRIIFENEDINKDGGELILKCVAEGEERDKRIIKNLSSNYNEEEIDKAHDEDFVTRWTSGIAQQDGMYVQIELEKEYLLAQVKLDLEDSPWDYPVNMLILVSKNGDDWETVEYKSEDNELFCFASPIYTKWIRFVLGKKCENVTTNWSIYEVELFSSIEPKETELR